jgi:hypothetical protein
MSLTRGLRVLTLLLSAAVAVTGGLIVAGRLDRDGITAQTRIAIGAAIVAYGVYKFTVTWFRRREEETP